jgi:peptidoglycan/xylan/chitin deacetylase (PgdA/CDA1 family)
MLDLLDKHNQTATFFVMGELYDWYPDVIEGIEKRGHEIGYHTHSHRLIQNSEILEEELKKSSDFLNRFNPMGFRAPKIFITRDTYSCLKKYGFKYSSSTYSEYKIININGIDEIPVSTFCYRGSCYNNQRFPKPLTLRMLSTQIPFGSGLFISILGPRTSYFIDSYPQYCFFIHGNYTSIEKSQDLASD